MTIIEECSHCRYRIEKPSEEDHFYLILCELCLASKGKEWDKRYKGIYGSEYVSDWLKKSNSKWRKIRNFLFD